MVWQAIWVELQANRQAVSDEFKFTAGALLGLGGGVSGGVGSSGTKQAVRQFATCELQVIMQFVTVELCAWRIFSPASAPGANAAAITITARIDAMLRLPLRGANPRRGLGRAAS